MASGTYNSGQSLAKNVISLGCTMGANEYPNGAFSLSSVSGSYFFMNAYGGPYTFQGYLCDSGGGNSAQCCSLTIGGMDTATGVSGSVSGATGLKGKALYLKFYGNEMLDQLQIRGSMSASIATAQATPAYVASTISASDVNFGSSSKVTFSNAKLSALKHKVTWTCGSHTNTTTTSVGASSASYTIPTSWMDAAASSTSVNLVIKVQTMNGSTNVGNAATKTVQAKVPSSVVPTLTSVTATLYNAQSGFANQYIQNVTGVTLTINGAEGGTGSSIKSYSVTCNQTESITQDTANKNVFRITKLKNGGSLTFTAKVKDNRDRESTAKTVTINVSEYSPPAISSVIAYRSKSDGVADEEGQYITIRCNVNYSDITNNSISINSIYWKTIDPSTTYTAQSDMVSGTQYTIGNDSIDPAYTYTVKFTAADSLGKSAISIVDVTTTMYSIHVKNGGTGVAFGKTSEINQAVEINKGWDVYYKGHSLVNDNVLIQVAASTHSFVVPSSSRNLIVFASGDNSRTWIGYIFCDSAGTVNSIEIYKGSNVTLAVDTNTIEFSAGSTYDAMLRTIHICGDPITDL